MGVHEILAIISGWAEKSWVVSKGRSSALDQDVRCEINWDAVTLSLHEEDPCKIWTLNKTPKESLQTVYTGVFSNPRGSDTQHKIKMDKETDAQLTIHLTAGQTTGLPMPLSVDLHPVITKATPVFGHTIDVDTNAPSSKRIEKIKWAVDSNVPNPQDSSVNVNIQVKENIVEGKFECTAKLKGHVAVQIKRRQDNQFLGVVENDICEIFRPYVGGKSNVKDGGESLSIEDKSVCWKVAGDCKFIFGVENQVALS